MSMILNLKEYYGLNRPILIEDIQKDFDYSYDTIKSMLYQYVKNNEIKRYDKGIYYFPKKSRILGEVIPSFDEILEHKYIKKNNETFGYYSGIFLLNSIGLTAQVSIRREITTNIETNIKRTTKIGNREIILRKPLIEVTNENVKYLQFMDIFRYAYVSEIIEYKEEIVKFIKKNNLSKDELLKQVYKYYPNNAKANLIETRCYDELA